MSAEPTLDVSRLPAGALDHRALLWWGTFWMIVIEAAVFALILVSYAYLRLTGAAWPSGPEAAPGLGLPTLGLVLLLASRVPMRRAAEGAVRGAGPETARRLGLGLALALAFLVLRIIDWRALPYRWDTHPFGSLVWTILGLHTAHVVTAILENGVLVLLLRLGYTAHEQRLGVVTGGPYWDFVVFSWVPLYVAVYIAPRFV
ncbi:MAG TPA: cytochrome c oxidase subunit 3 [Methylomirabilota bacterium]|nr:cytochrome c oxidase subunit 3 [Methylomirabilota bacterium]